MFSKSNVKYIHSLQQKKFRDEYGVFVAEGPKVVGELLAEQNITCREVFGVEEWVGENSILTQNIGASVTTIELFQLEKISALAQPNKVVAVFEKPEYERDFDVTNRLTLVLDDIQDPGNFGTIIRTADWFGIEHIVCSKNCVDVFNPKVVQSTMSSIARVNFIYTDIVKWLKGKPVKKYAAVLDGSPLPSVKKVDEGILIMGNESKGISDETLQYVDEKITIPKRGRAESLNVAIATAIILNTLVK